MVGSETSGEDVVTICKCDPAGQVGEVCNAFKGRGECRHRYEVDSCTRDKKDIIKGEMHYLGNNKSDGANTNCLNSGPTNTMNGTRSNWAKMIEVRLQVADVDQHTSVQKERSDRRVDGGQRSLVGRLVGNAATLTG